MKKLLFIITIGILFYSCDKVDCPNEDGCVEPIIVIDTNCISAISGLDTCTLSGNLIIHHSDTVDYQKIVIEEYTGYKCTNCPDGAAEIAVLQSKFGDTLIPISIHAGSFSEPGDLGGHSYVTDFRTDAGNIYNDEFLGPGAGYPNAVINRTKYNGSSYSPPLTSWETVILDERTNSSINPPAIYMTSYYSSETNTVLVKSTVEFKEATSVNHRLLFLCIEGEVIDVQLDGANFIEDYEHKHVLRGSMNNSAGELINDSSVGVGDTFEVQSSYFTLDASWDANEIEIVAVLVDVDSKEIVQAELVHIK